MAKTKDEAAAKAARDYGTRALTLSPPWPWAITDLDKRVENRSRANSKEGPGGLWIHAGKEEDKAGTALLYEILSKEEADKLDKAIESGKIARGAVVAYCHMDPCRPVQQIRPADRWTAGPHCYPLSSVEKLAEPVPVAGKQGFFVLSDEIVAKCAAQLARNAGDGFEGPPESNRTPVGNEGAVMHGAKAHLPLTPAQVEAIAETLDRVADLELDIAPAKKALDQAAEKAEKAKKAVSGLNADRKKLLEHLVEIRSGKWQMKIPLGG